MPQENKEGYDAGSAMNYADKLKGRLMIYYGTADNNVHPNNSLQLIQALQQAGKSFEVQVGPDQGHSGIRRPHDGVLHREPGDEDRRISIQVFWQVFWQVFCCKKGSREQVITRCLALLSLCISGRGDFSQLFLNDLHRVGIGIADKETLLKAQHRVRRIRQAR